MCVCVCVCVCVCTCFCLSVYLSVCLSVCLSGWLCVVGVGSGGGEVNKTGHTCESHVLCNACVSAQLHILDDPQSVQLSNATATTTTTTATRTTTTATTATYCTKDLLAARGGQQASCRKTRLSTEQSWLALLVD